VADERDVAAAVERLRSYVSATPADVRTLCAAYTRQLDALMIAQRSIERMTLDLAQAQQENATLKLSLASVMAMSDQQKAEQVEAQLETQRLHFDCHVYAEKLEATEGAIGQHVARAQVAEEQLAEAQREIERLREAEHFLREDQSDADRVAAQAEALARTLAQAVTLMEAKLAQAQQENARLAEQIELLRQALNGTGE